MNEARCVDENLPNVNKTKHPTTKGGEKGYKMDGPKFISNEKTTNWGISQGEHEQIKDSNFSPRKEHVIVEEKRGDFITFILE